MKKIFFCLGVLSILLMGCSGDEKSNAPTLNSLPGIHINGALFLPSSSNPEFISTQYYDNPETGAHSRSFTLRQSAYEFLTVNVPAADANANVSGEFHFNTTGTATGMYWHDTTGRGLLFGTVTITDFGDLKYKVQFNDVKIYESGQVRYTITGAYEGVFNVST